MKLMAKKCSAEFGGQKGAVKVRYGADMPAVYEMAR
ncbi:hypothetical protein EDD76_111120 [Kineothrix alysoides]|uniref:Uncharacterized protein n=1 Tax=Kineothrix alysoides TaxID=1469948 RepID=A0A4R1QRX2_9FIRM|nr:hypothetical protein EDD76_111120 [Kineothrix alysoides]